MSKKLHLISLGCTKNLVDSEVMLGALREYKITDEVSEADVIIVNTCGFISAAKQESINTILEASSKRKEGALLVASGCLSERYHKELLEEMPEIDIITGVGDYDKINEMIEKKKGLLSHQVFLSENSERVITGSKIHAYVKLSEGCNQSCSFCSIPSFKGKLHSRSIQSAIKEVNALCERGYEDFSFVAQDSSSYLRDLGEKKGLIHFIDTLDKESKARSARILYLYPSTTTLELIEKIVSSKIVQNYFDMPIQHISESMLKRMKRGVGREEHIKLLRAMRETPNSFVRTTVIVGHPQESEEGTSAYEMEGHIPSKVINSRIAKLNKIITSQQKERKKEMMGKRFEVIVEGKSEVSEYFYSARCLLWAPQIDGEILVNEIDIDGIETLEAGYYLLEVSEVKDSYVFGKVIEKL